MTTSHPAGASPGRTPGHSPGLPSGRWRRRLRPVIASSWERSSENGLTPASVLDTVTLEEVDTDCLLLAAAGPVLDELAEALPGSWLGILLADRTGQVVARRFGHRDVEAVFDRKGAITGRRLDERTSGTNAIATALAVRESVAVQGQEHYLRSLKAFSCYGRPIVHPVTGRLEGVLDVTGPASLPAMGLAPLARLGARGVERRLWHGSREPDRELLAAFRTAAHRGDLAVVALGEDVVLTNDAAAELLSAGDHPALREIARRARSAPSRIPVRLQSGRAVDVRVLAGLEHGAVLAVRERAPSADEDRPANGHASGRALTPLEQAEHDVIVDTLAACGGNKVAAAARLGISRTTLYQRIRALRITA